MTGLFFDTESTGLYSPGFKPKLVQLGAILQDLDTGRVLGELNVINKKCGPIPVEASNVHGITADIVEMAGIDVRIIDAVFAHLMHKADLLVAHNIAYDVDIVHDNLPLTESVIGRIPRFCTMMGSLYIVKAPLSDKQNGFFLQHPELKDAPYKVPNLTETFKYFYGKPFEGAHDAMADIRACRDVFMSLQEEGYYQVVDGKVVPTDKLDQLVEAAS